MDLEAWYTCRLEISIIIFSSSTYNVDINLDRLIKLKGKKILLINQIL